MADKIAGSDFEHHVLCDGPKGKIQEVFCNELSDRGAPGTDKHRNSSRSLKLKSNGEMAERLRALPC